MYMSIVSLKPAEPLLPRWTQYSWASSSPARPTPLLPGQCRCLPVHPSDVHQDAVFCYSRGLHDAFSFISILPEDTGFYSHVLPFAFSAPLGPFCNAFSTCATFKPQCWVAAHQKGWFWSVQQHAPQHHVCQALWWVSSREEFSIGLTRWISLPSSLMWCKRGCGPARPGVRQDHPSQNGELTQSCHVTSTLFTSYYITWPISTFSSMEREAFPFETLFGQSADPKCRILYQDRMAGISWFCLRM